MQTTKQIANASNPLYWGKLDTISSVKFRNIQKLQNVKESFFGSAPAPFVGHYGYPHINLGILAPPELRADATELDAQRSWAAKNLDIPEIVGYRSQLINSRQKATVSDARHNARHDSRYDPHRSNKLLEVVQEVALSPRAVDLEVQLKKKPQISFQTDPFLPPHKANAIIQRTTITENPHIPEKVDSVIADDLSAAAQLEQLNKHFDEQYLSKILSVGLLGKKENKKLVPTRWSITATDDTLGKQQIEELRHCSQNEDYLFYFGGYLGNYYAFLVFPEIWSYELFEIYAGDRNGDEKGTFMTDHEQFAGRKNYADNCVGGYYACRLALTEKLLQKKRQASILALRFITDDYTTPLGVWVCREASRKSLASQSLSFASKELLLDFVRRKIQNSFGIDCTRFYALSKLLKEQKQQRKLWEF